MNAYLIGTTAFAKAREAKFARFTGEFMGAEAVHRALALRRSFSKIEDAVTMLRKAGFGFGKKGDSPGAFYNFNDVRKRTPNPAGVNTRKPR